MASGSPTIFSPLRRVAVRDRMACRQRADGAARWLFGEVIDDVEGRHPGLKARIVDVKDDSPEGAAALRRFVNVYVNDEDVRFAGGLSAPVSDGDVVVVLPAVAGGSR